MSLAMIRIVFRLILAKARGMYVMGCASVVLSTNFSQVQDMCILGYDKGLQMLYQVNCFKNNPCRGSWYLCSNLC